MMILTIAAAAAMAPAPPAPPAPEQRRVVIVRKVGPDGKVTEQRLEGSAAARVAESEPSCDPARIFTSDTERTVGGKRQVNRIKVCARGAESAAQWRQALRSTQDQVRADHNLAPEVRDRVVAELQTAIDRAPR